MWQITYPVMKIPFTKMHGAGNDFIVVDDRTLTFPADNAEFIRQMASRRTGVGCEGIILIQPSESADLRMRFINPDGNEVEMCGNGARCFARFACELGAASAQMKIETVAGVVSAEVLGEQVRIDLADPSHLELNVDLGLSWPTDFVNTGVPHVVAWVDDLGDVDVAKWGRTIRYHEHFSPRGTNANFARVENDGSLSVRTYERGVEEETLACGTGAMAVAVLAAQRAWVSLPVSVHCASGHDLVVNRACGKTTLMGNAIKVFEGEMEYGDRV